MNDGGGPLHMDQKTYHCTWGVLVRLTWSGGGPPPMDEGGGPPHRDEGWRPTALVCITSPSGHQFTSQCQVVT